MEGLVAMPVTTVVVGLLFIEGNTFALLAVVLLLLLSFNGTESTDERRVACGC